MLCLIDSCQNEVAAEQYYVTISRSQVKSVSRSRVFLNLTANQVLVFDLLDCRLKSDSYSKGD